MKYKEIDLEAVRPLYYFGLALLYLGTSILITILPHRITPEKASSFNTQIAVGLLILYCLMIIQSTGMSERNVKDVLLGTIVDLSIFLMISGYAFTHDIKPDEICAWFADLVIISSIMSAMLGILLFAGILNLEIGGFVLAQSPSFNMRLQGHFGEPSQFGSLMGVGLICAVYMAYETGKKKYWIAALLLSTFLLLSGSRNGIVASIAGLSVASVLIFPKKSIVKALSVLSVVFAFSFICLLQIDSVSDFLMNIFRVGEENSFERVGMWLNAGRVFMDASLIEVLFGRGYGFQETMGCAFNLILRMLNDFGLVYVILFLVFVAYVLFVFLRAASTDLSRPAAFGLAMLVYSLVFSMFLDVIFSSFFHLGNFAFIFSLVVAATLSPISNKV